MKTNQILKLLNFLVLFGLPFPIFCQENYLVDMTYNTNYDGAFTSKQNLEATELLYKEINYYRSRNERNECIVSPTIVNYACRWGNYMVTKHVDESNNFYHHSYTGPDEYHIPNSCSEIIHLVYFGHKPSNVEIVSGLMYGVARPTGNVIGWIQSKGHNEALLQPEVKYYGASVYVIQQGQWWAVYSVVNFSLIQ